MELLTTKHIVACDTFNTVATAEMHDAKGKRKLLFTISDDKGEHKISLWEEDVLLLANFLAGMTGHMDSRL